ncbi:MAG: succinylglutamate desuccinylase/aspartoacylase family protein [Deltaproteobacteria bacterium]|nr:succinylglutamate desuccinylase/aspartoacylase family protein [Deltaproteobacteria bacterium]
MRGLCCQRFKIQFFLFCILHFASCIFIYPALARTVHDVHFKNTDHELNVYKIYGAEKGKTLMVIGGIQGDEPGGYTTADLYADMALKRGNLIVVPRANFLSIIEHKRQINNDMNRRFQPPYTKEYYEDRVVDILKDLIGQSDYLLNLHEGSGFFRKEWISDLKNPMRFGQSIIADTDVYSSKKSDKDIKLGDIARKIIETVNKNIEDPEYHFNFNNHRTFEKDTKHAEQRRSATYYAISTHEIPAFGIETSKEIKDLETKVRFQTMVVNASMEEFDIIPENPKIALDPPRLKYLAVNVNNTQNFIVQNGESIRVKKGDSVKISNVEANYERGLSVDFVGVGTLNDIQKDFEINAPTLVVVKKDGFKCGEIHIIPSSEPRHIQSDAQYGAAGRKSSAARFKYLVMEINSKKIVLSEGEHLNIIKGDIIKILDAVVDGVREKDIKVNFLGFVGDKTKNTGEDRGYKIHTANDLWVKYSKDGKGREYQVLINYKDKKIGEVVVAIEEPRMDYIVIKHGNGIKRWCSNNEVITIPANETLEVVDVKTNIYGNIGVKINLNNGKTSESVSQIIRLDKGSNNEAEIVVSREGIVMGRTVIKINDPLARADGVDKNFFKP